MSPTPSPEQMLLLTGQITAAYLRGNTLPVADIPGLVGTVHASLGQLLEPVPQPQEEPPRPAVPVRRSVTAEYIVCLEDGKKLKMLKRYLRTTHGLTPEQYRARWNLPADYPMVAPAYAERRSQLALSSGLGRRRAQQKPGPAPAGRGRRKTNS